MKNAWATYLIIRIGLFAGILAILMLLGVEPIASALFSAVLSLAISLVFFNRQRNAVSEAVARAIEKRKKFGESDADSDHENQLLDNADGDQRDA